LAYTTGLGYRPTCDTILGFRCKMQVVAG